MWRMPINEELIAMDVGGKALGRFLVNFWRERRQSRARRRHDSAYAVDRSIPEICKLVIKEGNSCN
jgi:hypothetical protein